MRSRALLLLSFVYALLSIVRLAAAAPGADAFTFVIPEGWIDLDDSASADAAALSPDVREARLRGADQRVLFAALPGEDVVMGAFMRAESESEPVDSDALARAAGQLGAGGFDVEEKRIETVDGIAWGRFTGQTAKQSRFVVYLVPGRPRSAFVMFSAPPASFDRHLAAFEIAAKRTRGAANPERKSHFPIEALILPLMASVALWWRFLRKRPRGGRFERQPP